MGIEQFDAPAAAQVMTMEEIRQEAREMELSGKIANALNTFYPGHLWLATCTGGVLYVQNIALDGQWGFVLHINKLENIEKAAMRSGGELLERFRIHRGAKGAEQAHAFLVDRMKQPVLKLPEWVK